MSSESVPHDAEDAIRRLSSSIRSGVRATSIPPLLVNTPSSWYCRTLSRVNAVISLLWSVGKMKLDACPVDPPGFGRGPFSMRTMSVRPAWPGGGPCRCRRSRLRSPRRSLAQAARSSVLHVLSSRAKGLATGIHRLARAGSGSTLRGTACVGVMLPGTTDPPPPARSSGTCRTELPSRWWMRVVAGTMSSQEAMAGSGPATTAMGIETRKTAGTRSSSIVTQRPKRSPIRAWAIHLPIGPDFPRPLGLSDAGPRDPVIVGCPGGSPTPTMCRRRRRRAGSGGEPTVDDPDGTVAVRSGLPSRRTRPR